MTTRSNRMLALTGLLILASACGPSLTTGADTDRVRVIATFSVLGDLVSNVGGEHVDLTVLAGPGVDTHTYSPAAADAAALAQADVIFENGLEFESWLDDLVAASGAQAARIEVSVGIETRTGEAGHDEDEQAEDEHAEDEAEHGALDPHIWHSAANAILMVRNIRDALIAADPAHAADYRANADAFSAEIQSLDEWILAEVQRVPTERRLLVTTHDTFAYFADRYGFEVVGAVLPTSTEGVTPSAQELARLVDAIRAAGVPAVFAENVSSSGLLNQVADEAGVTVIASLFTDALGPPGSAGATYLDMMRFNVTTIVSALAG